MVVRTSVLAGELFLSCARLMDDFVGKASAISLSICPFVFLCLFQTTCLSFRLFVCLSIILAIICLYTGSQKSIPDIFD